MTYKRIEKNIFEEELREIAKKLVAPEKGILAADESTGTIGKRFDNIHVENNLDNRRIYRKALFTTKDLNKHISGVIMYDETARDVELTQPLKDNGIILGIKVDMGTKKMPLSHGFFYTQGLDNLDDRCKEYYSLGCRFAKWRAVLQIEDGYICPNSVQETAYTLARYAATCQANGLVPIVEPEILMDGSHCLGMCRRNTERVLANVFKCLADQNVLLEGMILKVNMVVPGNEWTGKRSFADNALATITALRRTLPVAVPGVTFLSGGQSEEEATQNLNEMNKLGPHPWALTFSYGRALQQSALHAWCGKDNCIEELQKALTARAKANGEASVGKYAGGSEGSDKSLFQKGYTY